MNEAALAAMRLSAARTNQEMLKRGMAEDERITGKPFMPTPENFDLAQRAAEAITAGHSHKETAELLGVSLSSMRNHVSRARRLGMMP